jgi:membrane protein YqaA with SNARE-associated domain
MISLLSERTKAIVQIVFGIIIAAIVLLFSDRIAELSAYGYIGVFLISLLSSATILIPAPGWAVVIALSKTLDPYILGIAAGVGSGLGEMVSYEVGNGARRLIDKNDNNIKAIEKYGAVAIFFLAFIPNPLFDVAGLAAGALKMPMWKFLLATVSGRILRFFLLAYLGSWALAQF